MQQTIDNSIKLPKEPLSAKIPVEFVPFQTLSPAFVRRNNVKWNERQCYLAKNEKYTRNEVKAILLASAEQADNIVTKKNSRK